MDKTYEIRSVDGFVNGDEEDEWKMRYYTECDSLRRHYADRDVSRELFFKSRGLIKNDLRCRNFFN